MDATDPSAPAKAGLASILDGVALALLVCHLVLRLTITAVDPVWSTNLLIHAMVWPAAAVWLLARVVEGQFPLHLSGLELPLVAWGVLCVISIQRAPVKILAIDTAVAFVAVAMLVPTLLHVVGPARRELFANLLQSLTGAIAVYALLQVFVVLPWLRTHPETIARLEAGGADLEELRIRLMGNEPWATFGLSNQLAGFLVLMLPFIAGSIWDAVRSKRSSLFLAARGAALLAGLVALFMTGSKGGWGAFLVAIGAGAVFVVAHFRPTRRRLILAVGLPLLVVALGAGWFVTTSRVKSMQFRAAYAQGAIKAWKTAPVMGIGLSNVEDAYTKYKPELQQEARRTHNDYVQVLAELGILGLLALLAILAMAMRRALAPAQATVDASFSGMIPLAVGAFLALLLGVFINGDLWWLFGLAVPLAFGIAAGARSQPADVTFTRLGLAAGFCGMLAHLCVDFDLYDYGTAAALFAAMGMLVLYAKPFEMLDGGRLGALVAAVLVVVISIPLSRWATRFQKAEDLMALSQEKSTPPQVDLEGAWKLLEEASSQNPFDPEIHTRRAGLFMMTWSNLRSTCDYTVRALSEMQLWEELVQEAWSRAILLRSTSAPIRYNRALVHEQFSRFYVEASRRNRDERLPAMARRHLLEARTDLEAAIERYPTRPVNHAALGRVFDGLGADDDAAREYQEALRLSALAFDTARIRLTWIDVARALCRTGRTDDAVEPLKRHVDALLDRTIKSSQRKFSPDELLTIIEDMKKDPVKYVDESFHPSMQKPLDRAVFELQEKVRENARALREAQDQKK